jgi:cell wall-associated NlpC family hydrolase
VHHHRVRRRNPELVREQRAVRIARTYVGVPYVYGGASRSGTDCSGLTMAVYARVGVRLAHYTGSQWHAGPHVPRRALRPGDLVFFDGSATPGHVGIYIGAGRFIHAPHTGTVVQTAWLSTEPGYVGAVRPRA